MSCEDHVNYNSITLDAAASLIEEPKFGGKNAVMIMTENKSSMSEKVVIQFGDKHVKGYLESPRWTTLDELLRNSTHCSPQTFRVRHLESELIEEIPVSEIKAVFYVNSFDGNSDHKELNFYSRAPITHGIWVRITFLDGEVMEGIVYNSIRYLVDPGFFLIPTDPGCNNKLVYVVKGHLADHRVLGLRKL
jgi:hypothetical protein